MSRARLRISALAVAAGLVALLATGVVYAEGGFGGQGTEPVIAGAAPASSIPGYPGWSYSAAVSDTGAPCIVLSSPFGTGRTCAVAGASTGMLSAGFVTDEATGDRYGFVMGFAQPREQTRTTFSDGSTRVGTSSDEGAYVVPVTPDDISQGILPTAVVDSSGAALASDLPRDAFEAS